MCVGYKHYVYVEYINSEHLSTCIYIYIYTFMYIIDVEIDSHIPQLASVQNKA